MSAALNPEDPPTRGPAKIGPYAVSGVLLAVAIVFPLLVPTYAKANPHLAGLPYFYWYQMLWVPIDSVLIGICYILMTREDKRRRAVLRGGGEPKHAAPGEPDSKGPNANGPTSNGPTSNGPTSNDDGGEVK